MCVVVTFSIVEGSEGLKSRKIVSPAGISFHLSVLYPYLIDQGFQFQFQPFLLKLLFNFDLRKGLFIFCSFLMGD